MLKLGESVSIEIEFLHRISVELERPAQLLVCDTCYLKRSGMFSR